MICILFLWRANFASFLGQRVIEKHKRFDEFVLETRSMKSEKHFQFSRTMKLWARVKLYSHRATVYPLRHLLHSEEFFFRNADFQSVQKICYGTSRWSTLDDYYINFSTSTRLIRPRLLRINAYNSNLVLSVKKKPIFFSCLMNQGKTSLKKFQLTAVVNRSFSKWK